MRSRRAVTSISYQKKQAPSARYQPPEGKRRRKKKEKKNTPLSRGEAGDGGGGGKDKYGLAGVRRLVGKVHGRNIDNYSLVGFFAASAHPAPTQLIRALAAPRG